MERKTIIIIAFFIFFVVACAVVFPIVVAMTTKPMKSFEQRFGSSAPSGQTVVIAQRNDNSKWQVLLSTSSGSGTSVTWDKPYYIVFNPTTSTDPTMTVFDTILAANDYSQSDFVASPANKSFSTISTSALNADYKSITPYYI